jgi:hypothetical protein
VPNVGYRPSEETRARLRAAWVLRRLRLPGFWERVDKSAECWVWTRGKTTQGYGQYQEHGRFFLAHRWGRWLARRHIPDGLELDHLCRNRACVRPDHLEAVAPKVNQQRGMSPSGVNSRKTQCPRGHEYSVQATGKRAGRRRCVECHRERNRQSMRDNYRRVEP